MHGLRKTNASKVSRRNFFETVADGLYGAALATLFSRELRAGPGTDTPANTRLTYDLKPLAPHFPAKARAVIQLFMGGGPSHVDLFDPKPLLEKKHGEKYFSHKIAAELSNPEGAGRIMRSPFKFQQYGQSGMWVSDLMPHLAKQVDDIALIRSMFTNHPNHEPALYMIHSGRMLPGRPGIGAWVVYGLGSENQNLPAYVVLDDPKGLPNNGTQGWQAGFLPPIYQGSRIRSVGSPILDLQPETPKPTEVVRLSRNLVAGLDQIHQRSHPGELALDARIASYELAARLQLEASEALDIRREDPKTLEMYGVGVQPTDSYGRRCLMARRLVERGVRFVQLYGPNKGPGDWDHHTNLKQGLEDCCGQTDKPVAALIQDLKRTGLWKDTLILWGGEFGRTGISEIRKDESTAGRDHNPKGFSLWMAGAGVKPGTVYGTTDEIGFEAVENPVSVTDWQATVLHLLGLDYRRLTYNVNGLPEKLTSIYEARVVKEILA